MLNKIFIRKVFTYLFLFDYCFILQMLRIAIPIHYEYLLVAVN